MLLARTMCDWEIIEINWGVTFWLLGENIISWVCLVTSG